MRSLLVVVAFSAAISAQVATSIVSASTLATITSSATFTSGTGLSGLSTSGPYTHTVAVAKAAHKFEPDITVAEVGDVIEFQFYPTNHSVARAEYGFPCVPYELVLGAGHYGFFSGFKPVDTILDEPPSWSLTVNDTDPIFFYCGAINSCIGYQMIGVINPNASTSLEKQKQLAKDSSYMLVPGEDWPSEGDIPSGVATTSRTPSPTALGTPATVTATAAAATPAPHQGLGAGTIAGIAIGGAAVLLAAAVAIWFCGRQSRKGQIPAPTAPAQEIHPGYMASQGSTYGKPGHMSTISGYSMPPQYHQETMPVRSPTTGTPIDPMMGMQQPLMHSGAPSPNLANAALSYGQNHPNMYAVGTHNVTPVEMGMSEATSPRRSMEKNGVERYS